MVSSPSDIPSDAPGHIIINAQLYAAPGKADRVQALLSNVAKNANSDAEPDCFQYRTVRSFVEDGIIKFAVWEIYKNPAALKTHFDSKAFGELKASFQAESLLDRPPAIEYFYEF